MICLFFRRSWCAILTYIYWLDKHKLTLSNYFGLNYSTQYSTLTNLHLQTSCLTQLAPLEISAPAYLSTFQPRLKVHWHCLKASHLYM